MTDRIDRTERLLNLVICLLGASQPVSRAAIREQIPGYGESASDVAFERMFERDKEELRSMGIPVETVADSGGEVLGYRIQREAYALDPIAFTVEERAAIAVAAQAWRSAPIAPVPGTALRKLESSGAGAWTPAPLAGHIEMVAADAALLSLMRALREGRVVRFDYRAPAQAEAMTRRISPWGLTSAAGHWFLLGYDHDREAERTFRLSRIVGSVQVTADVRHPSPPGFDPAQARLAATGEASLEVRLRVRPGRAASLRRRARPERGIDPLTADEITLAVGSVEEAVGLVCGSAGDAVVLEPAEVVAATVATLRVLAGWTSEVPS
jgi:proteasome accessory factor B